MVGADPFVTSAPLIVAAICSDGVALLALHIAFQEEPLLLDTDDVDDIEEERITNSSEDHNAAISLNNTTVQIKDMPRSYRGPFRIYSIDGFGTGMVYAGWRSHGQLVADYCRDLAKEELQVYGPPRMTLTSCKEYGHYLAFQTSAWMAYTAVLRKHPWSCVGLLATSSGGESCNKEDGSKARASPGCLWLVDTTGAYRILAHAVGGGPLAGIVNHYLAQRLFPQKASGGHDQIPSPLPSAEELLRDILDFLSHQHTIIPSGTRAELAVISPDSTGNARLKRVFASRLFGAQTSS